MSGGQGQGWHPGTRPGRGGWLTLLGVVCVVAGHRFTGWIPTPDGRGATRTCARCRTFQGWSASHPEDIPSVGASTAAVIGVAMTAVLIVGVAIALAVGEARMDAFTDWLDQLRSV